MVFSTAGLQYDSYAWGAAYTTDGIDDVSSPDNASLPTALSLGTFGDNSEVDVLLSNVTDDGSDFGVGTLVTLSLTVPPTFAGPGPVVISVEPDQFTSAANPFVLVPTVAGPDFTLIIPEPGVGVVMLAGFAAVLGRRRRRILTRS